jgi:hypothetical protein
MQTTVKIMEKETRGKIMRTKNKSNTVYHIFLLPLTGSIIFFTDIRREVPDLSGKDCI